MMDRREMTEIAYDMQEAYQKQKTQGEAIEVVVNKHSSIDINILWAMWVAIDAYVDINT
jgi:hypothetical protein